MELSCTVQGNTACIVLIGQLWLKEDLVAFERAIETSVENSPNQVIVDVDRLSFISSQGLGVLVRAHVNMERTGGKLILFSPRPSVLEVLEVSGFELFMRIARNADELDTLLSD